MLLQGHIVFTFLFPDYEFIFQFFKLIDIHGLKCLTRAIGFAV